MRYWDTAGIVPLTIAEATTDRMLELLADDAQIVTWWGSSVEVISALARRHREGALTAPGLREGLDRLEGYQRAWAEIQPGDPLRRAAARLLRVHPLRAGDALQLASAIEAAGGRPDHLPFVTLDLRLAEAASKEGFTVPGPADD